MSPTAESFILVQLEGLPLVLVLRGNGWFEQRKGTAVGRGGSVGSPVEGAGQEVGGGSEPAGSLLARSHPANCLVGFWRRTLLLREVLWQVHVLLHLHRTALREVDQNLETKIDQLGLKLDPSLFSLTALTQGRGPHSWFCYH